jgi:hypothetical protein
MSAAISPGGSRNLLRTRFIAIAVVAMLTAVFLVLPFYRLLLPIEIDRNEPWNAWHADSVRLGLALYPPSGALIVNNYPPLSFILTAALASFGIDTIYAGRTLSLAGLGLTATGIGLTVCSIGGDRFSGWFAALWFIATIARFFFGYVGMNDPAFISLGAMSLASWWFVRAALDGGRLALPLAAMVSAGFIKHSNIAAPAAALIWLMLYEPRRAMRCALAGAAMALAGLALCVFVYGPQFVDNLLMPREYSLVRPLRNAGRLQFILPALLVWAIWLSTSTRSRAATYSAILIALSLGNFLLMTTGEGVANNAQFELDMAAAIGMGLAVNQAQSAPLDWRGYRLSLPAIIAVLALRLVFSTQTDHPRLLFDQNFRADLQAAVHSAESEARRVAAMRGNLDCSIMSACYRAGKRFVYDGFFVSQQLKTGKWSEAQVRAALEAQHIRSIDIDTATVWGGIMRRAAYGSGPHQ